MKTDNYLTLCLEQAAKSPLHYRHGCIVVRGGKVIGQGYNDYRPGVAYLQPAQDVELLLMHIRIQR